MVQIDDRPLGSRSANVDEKQYEDDGNQTGGQHWCAQLRQGQLRGPRKAHSVDEQAAGERPTSTRCRFCGYEEGGDATESVREKSHLQVVVACGSCGHPFAVLSRN
jgi:hypothetical protein